MGEQMEETRGVARPQQRQQRLPRATSPARLNAARPAQSRQQQPSKQRGESSRRHSTSGASSTARPQRSSEVSRNASRTELDRSPSPKAVLRAGGRQDVLPRTA